MRADAFDIERIRNATSIGEFDDAYIAAIYGFKDKYDYYDKNICISFLKSIRVPTLMINARDDPFFDPSALPGPQHVQVVLHLWAMIALIYGIGTCTCSVHRRMRSTAQAIRRQLPVPIYVVPAEAEIFHFLRGDNAT